jgi:hypothetical protein
MDTINSHYAATAVALNLEVKCDGCKENKKY